MRTMISLDNMKDKVKVHEHVMLSNFWEYYLEEPNADGVAFGYVMGHDSEYGFVDLAEIKPYVMSRMKLDDTSELMPAVGFKWEEAA